MRRLPRVAGRASALLAIAGRSLARPPGGSPHERAEALARALERIAARHGMGVYASGPTPPPGAVVVVNHVSWLDPVVVLPLAPAVPIAKAQIGHWPLIGAAARALGVVLVDRDSTASRVRALRAAIRALGAGARVLNFPEGTTTTGREVGAFQRGIFGAARIAGAPIAPAALAYDPPGLAWVGDDSFLPHYARTAALPAFSCRLVWGEPIDTASGDADQLARIARARVRELLRRIHDEPGDRVRVPSPRPEPVLPLAAGRAGG